MTMIWVTRPGSMGQALCRRLEVLGYQTRQASPINIQQVPVTTCQRQQLAYADWLVFVSPNAVDYYPEPIARQAQIAVVGKATCQNLQAYHYSVDVTPSSFSSDGLLQTAPFQQDSIQGQQVIIVKGQGGRQEWINTLKQRGAHVSELVCYRRQVKSDYFPADYYQQSDWLIVTSSSILQALWQLTPQDQRDHLQQLQLLVSSQRLLDDAKARGFANIYRCNSAHRDDIVNFFYSPGDVLN